MGIKSSAECRGTSETSKNWKRISESKRFCCDVRMSRFSKAEIEAFFDAHVEEMDDYIDILNIAHLLSPEEGWEEMLELVSRASEDLHYGLISACVLEPLIDLHYAELHTMIENELRSNALFRSVLKGCYRLGRASLSGAMAPGIS